MSLRKSRGGDKSSSSYPPISDQYVQDEYRKLSQATLPKPRTEADYHNAHSSATLPCNKSKNRYIDVLPVEDTRIKLETLPDEPGSDYINANHVRDPIAQTQTYICSQAPLQSTLNDFWRMVWEQNVCVIVILMRLSENGKIKGHRYWPQRSKRVLQFNTITVTLSKRRHFPLSKEDSKHQQKEQTTIRTLELTRGDQKRTIVQLHFKDWPDFGVPESTDPIRSLVHLMHYYREKAMQQNLNGPVLIHCSAGIGRTGTYLAIVFALGAIKQLKEEESDTSQSAIQETPTKTRSNSEPVILLHPSDELTGPQLVHLGSSSIQPNGHNSNSSNNGTNYTSIQNTNGTKLSPRSANLPPLNIFQSSEHDCISSLSGSSTSNSSSSSVGGGVAYAPREIAILACSPVFTTSPMDPLQRLTSTAQDLSLLCLSESQQQLQLAQQQQQLLSQNQASTPPPSSSLSSMMRGPNYADSPFKLARSDSTTSVDSVVYEHRLIDDEDEDEEDEEDEEEEEDEDDEVGHETTHQLNDGGGSGDETDSEEEAADLAAVRSFLRPGAEIPVNIMNIVLSLRKQRNRGMVQTEEQYKFIYRAVEDEIASQRLKLSDSVKKFMEDASNDVDTPLSGRIHSARRKSQPRSPRSTQCSLGSSVSLHSSGIGRLSSTKEQTASTSSTGGSHSGEEDEEDLHMKLKSSEGGLFDAPPIQISMPCVSLPREPKRSLAMSSADIPPNFLAQQQFMMANPMLTQSTAGVPGNPTIPSQYPFFSSSSSTSNPASSSSLQNRDLHQH